MLALAAASRRAPSCRLLAASRRAPHRRAWRRPGVMAAVPAPLWLDVDAGVDDAQGLLLALAHPGVQVVGISAVHGNVEVGQVGRNVARLLTLCGRPEVPFYIGAAEPYLAPAAPPTYYYGRDGLGDAPEAHPPSSTVRLTPRPGHAAVQLAAAAERAGGELTVVATGPLTNLALAAKLDPAFPQNVKELFVMGGAEGAGNATAAAEYNFWWDVEAAHVVIRAFPRLTLLTWDCCLRHRLPWPQLDAWLVLDTPKARFLAAIMRGCLEKERAGEGSEQGWIPLDPLAMALAAAPEQLLLGQERRRCRVGLGPGPERGRSVFGGATAGSGGGSDCAGSDDRSATEGQADGKDEGWGTVRLVKEVDMGGFARMMAAVLEGTDE